MPITTDPVEVPKSSKGEVSQPKESQATVRQQPADLPRKPVAEVPEPEEEIMPVMLQFEKLTQPAVPVIVVQPVVHAEKKETPDDANKDVFKAGGMSFQALPPRRRRRVQGEEETAGSSADELRATKPTNPHDSEHEDLKEERRDSFRPISTITSIAAGARDSQYSLRPISTLSSVNRSSVQSLEPLISMPESEEQPPIPELAPEDEGMLTLAAGGRKRAGRKRDGNAASNRAVHFGEGGFPTL